jgi:hypothetical protein
LELLMKQMDLQKQQYDSQLRQISEQQAFNLEQEKDISLRLQV